MNDNTKLIVAALAGAAAGFVAGILLAPDKGSETRDKIKDGLKKTVDEVLDKIEKGLDDLSSEKKP
jgi:gas vesicle protein